MAQRTLDLIPGIRFEMHFQCVTSATLGCHTLTAASIRFEGVNNVNKALAEKIEKHFGCSLPTEHWSPGVNGGLAAVLMNEHYANTDGRKALRKALFDMWCRAVWDTLRHCGYLFISDQIYHREDSLCPGTSSFVEWLINEEKCAGFALPVIANPNYYWHSNPGPHIDQAWVFIPQKPHQPFGVAWDTAFAFNSPPGKTLENMVKHFSGPRKGPSSYDYDKKEFGRNETTTQANNWQSMAGSWISKFKDRMPAFRVKPSEVKYDPKISSRLPVYMKMRKQRGLVVTAKV